MQQHAIKQRKHGKAMTSKVNYSRYGYFFVAPFIIAFVVFTLYSIIFTVQISFTNLTNWRLDEMSPVGIENYKLLLDPSTPVGSGFWAAFSNTLIIWVVNFVPQLLIALLLAQWFTDSRLRIRFQGGF